MLNPNMNKITLSNIDLALVSHEKIVSMVEKAIENKIKLNLLYCDFRILNYLKKNDLKIFSSKHTVAYPDSSGVYFTLRILFNNKVKEFKKLIGTNIISDLLNICNRGGIKIFLYGDTSFVLNKMRNKIQYDHPEIQIVGIRDGFSLFENHVVEEINNSGADLLLIGLGVPKQEIWLNRYADMLNTKINITVGAFFSFYGGKLKRAPALFQKIHLEWIIRLVQNPLRLWKRYLFEFPYFFITVLKEKFSKK
jgi:N-acetylglucosaminyldiphosphoundecaprenol N-acetyl-beta-D-mannosaminyltransferase